MSETLIGDPGPRPRRAHTAQADPTPDHDDDTTARPRPRPEWRVAGERGHLITDRHYTWNPFNVGTGCGQLIQPSTHDNIADLENYPACRACLVVSHNQGIPIPRCYQKPAP